MINTKHDEKKKETLKSKCLGKLHKPQQWIWATNLLTHESQRMEVRAESWGPSPWQQRAVWQLSDRSSPWIPDLPGWPAAARGRFTWRAGSSQKVVQLPPLTPAVAEASSHLRFPSRSSGLRVPESHGGFRTQKYSKVVSPFCVNISTIAQKDTCTLLSIFE